MALRKYLFLPHRNVCLAITKLVCICDTRERTESGNKNFRDTAASLHLPQSHTAGQFYPGPRGMFWGVPNPWELCANLCVCVCVCVCGHMHLSEDHTSPESLQRLSIIAVKVKIMEH